MSLIFHCCLGPLKYTLWFMSSIHINILKVREPLNNRTSCVRTNLFLAAGKDYHAIIPRIVHFPGEAPDTSRQCITVNIIDDEEVEGEKPESFSLSLSVYDIAVVVSTSSATVFIMDDEDGT